jgi:hypothetical protein
MSICNAPSCSTVTLLIHPDTWECTQKLYWYYQQDNPEDQDKQSQRSFVPTRYYISAANARR